MRIVQPRAFKKDLKKQHRRGKDLAKLRAVVDLLHAGQPLPKKCVDHSLSGNWTGWRDCHIEADWVLIYKITSDTLILGRTGSHSDLF